MFCLMCGSNCTDGFKFELCMCNMCFQLMRLNAKGQLGVGERCIEADAQGIKLVFCRLGTVDGPWEYDEVM